MMKKGYMYTLEAFIAFIITFAFIIFVVASRESASSPETPQIYVLKNFEQREDFRECVHMNNITCIEGMINISIPPAYGFYTTINDASYQREENLYVDTIYITGQTARDQHIVRLYYWKQH